MTNVETLEDLFSKMEGTTRQTEFDQAWDVVFWNDKTSQYEETVISDLSEDQALRVLDELKL